MALKATIFKIELSLSDLDRNYYNNFSLTLAQHPSENDVRMMVRLLAFMLYADEYLEFGKGLSTDDEPDLWQKDLTGAIERWIYVGQLDERWIKKAVGKSREVVLISYGDKAADVWWEQTQPKLAKVTNLTVLRFSASDVNMLAECVSRSMELQCTIQDREMMISHGDNVMAIKPEYLKINGLAG